MIRTRLKESQIDDSWDTSTWLRQTSELPKTKEQSIMTENETMWTGYQKEVAGVLRVKRGSIDSGEKQNENESVVVFF